MTMPPDAPPPPPGGYPPPPPAMTGIPNLAGWPMRAAGALIDGVIVGVPYVILAAISRPLGWLFWVAAVLYLMYLQGTTGQTPGKRVVKIKLVRERDGQVVGFGLALGRYFVHALDAIPCGLGYLWPLWDQKKQTFADKVLQTVVVQL